MRGHRGRRDQGRGSMCMCTPTSLNPPACTHLSACASSRPPSARARCCWPDQQPPPPPGALGTAGPAPPAPSPPAARAAAAAGRPQPRSMDVPPCSCKSLARGLTPRGAQLGGGSTIARRQRAVRGGSGTPRHRRDLSLHGPRGHRCLSPGTSSPVLDWCTGCNEDGGGRGRPPQVADMLAPAPRPLPRCPHGRQFTRSPASRHPPASQAHRLQ